MEKTSCRMEKVLLCSSSDVSISVITIVAPGNEANGANGANEAGGADGYGGERAAAAAAAATQLVLNPTSNCSASTLLP